MVRERAAGHGITVTVEVADDVDTIDADELRFKQVVLNLLTNAVKFTPDGGSVVAARLPRGDRPRRDGHRHRHRRPDEDQERIFESFQQGGRGAPKEEGTGLGLTLSRRIVELLGGRMWLESEVGVGSTFGFAIPVRAYGPTPSARTEAARCPPSCWSTTTGLARPDLGLPRRSPTRVLRASDGVEASSWRARNCRPPSCSTSGCRGSTAGRCWPSSRPTRRPPPSRWSSLDRRRAVPRPGHGRGGLPVKPVGRDELIDALEAWCLVPARLGAP